MAVYHYSPVCLHGMRRNNSIFVVECDVADCICGTENSCNEHEIFGFHHRQGISPDNLSMSFSGEILVCSS
jgi:hypothetical protein